MSGDANPGYLESLGPHATNPALPRGTGEDLTIFWPCAACGGRRADASGPCPGCKGTGRSAEVRARYTVPPCEFRIKAQFEQWLRRNARAAVQVAEAEDGPEEGARLR